MSALLNAISGITKSNIKFLIATNLPTLRHVDPALYRPGRAFRVMEFDKLNAEEAVAAERLTTYRRQSSLKVSTH
jgi:ATP-dependent 26S proteasome regulatory subunit